MTKVERQEYAVTKVEFDFLWSNFYLAKQKLGKLKRKHTARAAIGNEYGSEETPCDGDTAAYAVPQLKLIEHIY